MNLLTKRAFFFAAGAVFTGTLILVAPRTAHAVAAALVQVTNTASNPVVTQLTTKSASQLVLLNSPAFETISNSTGAVEMEQNGVPFVVPAGKNLVITDIDLHGYDTGGSLTLRAGLSVLYFAAITNTNFQQIRFSSGIVYAAGSSVAVFENSAGGADVFLHGYLTSN